MVKYSSNPFIPDNDFYTAASEEGITLPSLIAGKCVKYDSRGTLWTVDFGETANKACSYTERLTGSKKRKYSS